MPLLIRVVGSCNGDDTIERFSLFVVVLFCKLFLIIVCTAGKYSTHHYKKIPFLHATCDPKNIFFVSEKMPKRFIRKGTGEFIDPWDGIRERVGDGREKNLVVTKLGYMEKSKQTYVLSKT